MLSRKSELVNSSPLLIKKSMTLELKSMTMVSSDPDYRSSQCTWPESKS